MFRGIAGSSGDTSRRRLYTRSNLRHLHSVYGVSGTKLVVTKRKRATNPLPPRSIRPHSWNERCKKRGPCTQPSIRLFQDAPRKFYRRPDYRISREGESIEYIHEWNLLFFSFFSSSFPLPRRNWSKDSDPPSRGSPREIRSGGQSGLIKRY